MRAANDGEADSAPLFGLGDLLGCARCGFASSSSASELFCVGENEVHVLHPLTLSKDELLATDLVECEHLPDHLPTILKCDLHAVVDLQLVSSMRL